jgi:hypothetical protein
MTVETVLFYLFAAILVVAALGVITARNPVHAACHLRVGDRARLDLASGDRLGAEVGGLDLAVGDVARLDGVVLELGGADHALGVGAPNGGGEHQGQHRSQRKGEARGERGHVRAA